MLKKLPVFLLTTLSACIAQAQSLRILNTADSSDITNASIIVQSVYNNGYQGYESLNLGIRVINISGNTVEAGAKKIEEDTLQPDVQHTICFAGGCYPAATYVSPLHVSLSPNESDASFLAHYLFDNTVHVRGINHVSYVFYNVQQPEDSVIVHVEYNTVVPTGFQPIAKNGISLPYPNPAKDNVSFLNSIPYPGPLRLAVTDINGRMSILLPSGNTSSFNTEKLTEGLYNYRLLSMGKELLTGKLLIRH